MDGLKAPVTEYTFAGASEIARRIRNRELTASAVVEHFIARIEALNPVLNAFTIILADRARQEATQLDEEMANGQCRGVLHGVPMVIKDENDVAGTVTTFGSSAFATVKTADSAVVARLRAAGAIILGKTTMPEFGIWPFTETNTFGHTRNPWDVNCSPAGSSGGTAVAVAAGLCAAGIGGDGGGSIRLPASWCGLVGMKPQRGRNSTAPHPHLWLSLGAVGPLTRNVQDSALINSVIAGATVGVDQFAAGDWDGECIRQLASGERVASRPLKIAYTTVSPAPAILKPDENAVQAIRQTVQYLEQLGHETVEVTPRYPKVILPFLAQFFGGVVREAMLAETPEKLEKRTRALIRFGQWSKSERLIAWAQNKAAKAWQTYQSEWFSAYDVLLMPTTRSAAVPTGQLTKRGFIAALNLSTKYAGYTTLWNACGNPAISLPIMTTATGLPIGVQLVGKDNSEALLYTVAQELEDLVRWDQRTPTLGNV